METICRNEHPRPDRVRDAWMTLNGQWDFASDPDDAGKAHKWYRKLPTTQCIEVPFCYQSALSGMDELEAEMPLSAYQETYLPRAILELVHARQRALGVHA